MKNITAKEIKEKSLKNDYHYKDFIFTDAILEKSAYNILHFGSNNLLNETKYNFQFENCIFNVNVNFNFTYDSSEEKAIFLKNVVFNEEVEFSSFKSKDKCSIENVKFMKNAVFGLSTFKKLNLSNLLFNGTVQFWELFIDEWICNDLIFNNSVVYTAVNIKKEFHLYRIEFNGNVDMGEPRILDEPGFVVLNYTIFERCFFKNKSRFYSIDFNTVKFKSCDFGKELIIFEYCKIRKECLFREIHFGENVHFFNMNLTKCSFLYSIINKVVFINCRFDFSKLYDYIYLKNEYEKDNLFHTNITLADNFFYTYCKNFKRKIFNIYHGDLLEPNTDLVISNANSILETYKMFETNFDYYKDYETAGEFHKKIHEIEKIINRRLKDISLANLITVLRFTERKFKVSIKKTITDTYKYYFVPLIKNCILNLYNWSSNYCENYIRPLLIYLLILFIFSILYIFSGLKYYVNQENKSITINYLSDSDTTHFNIINDIGVGFTFSLNSSIPIKKSFENTQAASDTTSIMSYFQTVCQTVLIFFILISLRRKFKR